MCSSPPSSSPSRVRCLVRRDAGLSTMNVSMRSASCASSRMCRARHTLEVPPAGADRRVSPQRGRTHREALGRQTGEQQRRRPRRLRGGVPLGRLTRAFFPAPPRCVWTVRRRPHEPPVREQVGYPAAQRSASDTQTKQAHGRTREAKVSRPHKARGGERRLNRTVRLQQVSQLLQACQRGAEQLVNECVCPIHALAS